MMEWTRKPFRWISDRVLYVSIPFTWNLPTCRNDFEHVDIEYDSIVVGGPAVNLMPDYFDDMPQVTVGTPIPGMLQRVNPQATMTTRGCVRRCKACSVPLTEGALVELKDWPDLPVICDNNITAASVAHFDRVCDRLERHSWSDFQGIDARLLTEHHAARLAKLRGCVVRLAFDQSASRGKVEQAYAMLTRAGFSKSRLRCYVLCGYESDVSDAWERCEIIQALGMLPLPMWYHPLDAMRLNAVLPCHSEYCWTEAARTRIMGYYYKHRGEKLLT